MATAVWVIEAPGKIAQLTASLRQLGLTGHQVVATKGHLCAFPSALSDLGIDQAFNDVGRTPTDVGRLGYLRSAISSAGTVFIAADPDQEGEVIGWDAYRLLREGSRADFKRVSLHGLDTQSIRLALQSQRPVNEVDSFPGRARAMVDRIIGATFSGQNRPVGRVVTGLLAALQRKPPPIGIARFVAPTNDGLPFVAEVPIYSSTSAEAIERAQQLASVTLPVLQVDSESETRISPMNMADILIGASRDIGVPAAAVQDCLQRGYEAGRLSYPRAVARTINADAGAILERIAADAGARFESRRVVTNSQDQHAHQAPHPRQLVDILTPWPKLDPDSMVAMYVARRLVRAGQRTTQQKPDTTGLPSWAANLPWGREGGWRMPGPALTQHAGVHLFSPDAVLVSVLAREQMGRPSTFVSHAARALELGLVDDQARVTPHGVECLAAAPSALSAEGRSAAIEAAIMGDGTMTDRAQAGLRASGCPVPASYFPHFGQ